MRFQDLPTFIEGTYETDVPLEFLIESLERYEDKYGLILEPDYQRGHVWNQKQQIAFVEHVLRGGKNTKIRWNSINWMGRGKPCPLELVDGKQRLTAVIAFLNNEIPVFGTYLDDFEDRFPNMLTMRFIVNDLKTRAEVLQWYLEINEGNVAHTDEELDLVRELLNQEG